MRGRYETCGQYASSISHSIKSLSMLEHKEVIEAQTVYDFTGNPSPQFLNNIMDILLNETVEAGLTKIGSSLKEMGIAL